MRPEHWLYTIPLRLRSLFRWAQADQEVDDELRDHLERKIDEYVAQGMTQEQAHCRARLDLGGIEQTKEKCREARRVNWIQDLIQDLRYGLRTLRKSLGFAAAAILILGLGIGANTAVFSVVNAVLLKPLPYREPGRIVTLSNVVRTPAAANALAKLISVPDFQDWHDQSTVFDAMAYYGTRRVSVTVGTSAEYARLTRVTREFFRVFEVQPFAGRLFTADEEEVGAGAVLVSSPYARQHFVEPSRALGQVLRVLDRPWTVVGVLPQAFDFPDGTDIWFPATAVATPSVTQRTANNNRAIGRLKRDVTLPEASAEMTSIAKRLEQAYPLSNSGKGVALTPLLDDTVGDTGAMLYLLLGAVGLVLLIACANVATLLLAKATGRAHEIAIRAALGASRARIVRQLLSEGLVLAIIAGVVGLVVAVWGTRGLVAIAPAGVPRRRHVPDRNGAARRRTPRRPTLVRVARRRRVGVLARGGPDVGARRPGPAGMRPDRPRPGMGGADGGSRRGRGGAASRRASRPPRADVGVARQVPDDVHGGRVRAVRLRHPGARIHPRRPGEGRVVGSPGRGPPGRDVIVQPAVA